MAEIFLFPGFDERGWLAIEAALHDCLKQGGIAPEGIAWIFAELKRRIGAALPSFRLPPISLPVPAGATQESLEFAQVVAKAVEENLVSVIYGLMTQIGLLVLDLYMGQSNVPPSLSKKFEAQILKLVPGGKNTEASSPPTDGTAYGPKET